MSDAAVIYRELQRLARQQRRPVSEILTLYGLERFLARLAETDFSQDFCLKGGVLLSAHALRRPTRDIDMQALDHQLDISNLTAVITAVTATTVSTADDGLRFDVGSVKFEEIRDDDEYSGLRVTLPASLATARILIKLDVSTGDPIWPAPEPIEIPGLLGAPIQMLGHPLPMVIAEKAVTMLQRGIASTRWRDFLDVGVLSDRYPFSAEQVRAAAEKVADHRGVTLTSLRPLLSGYGQVGQAKWAAWRRKLAVEELCRADLDDQVNYVLDFIDPVFAGPSVAGGIWDPALRIWIHP